MDTASPLLLDPRRIQFQRESSGPMLDRLEELARLAKLVEGCPVILVDGRLAVSADLGLQGG